MEVTPELKARLNRQAALMGEQASTNIEKWGGQTMLVLIACMAEELGEVAEATLRVGLDYAKTKEAWADAEREARDLGALCLQMATLCERKAEANPDD